MKREGRAREGDEKGRCEEERAWSAARLAGEKRASHEVHAFESDWDSDCVDWLRIAYPGGRGRDANASGSARARPRGYPGCVDGCRKECEREEGEGGFFPIKQPAEFVFSPKRRCRFKVIDCHREGGTDGMGGEPN